MKNPFKIPSVIYKILTFIIILNTVIILFNLNINSTEKSSKTLNNITQDMKSYKDGNITYYYDEKLESDNYFLKRMKLFISNGEKESCKYFGTTSKFPLKIIVFDSSNSFSASLNVNTKIINTKYGIPRVLALYKYNDKAIYTSFEDLSPTKFIHEYTHYKMNSFLKDNMIDINKIPIWFCEGVAEYVSSPYAINNYKGKSLEDIQDFKKLDNSKNFMKSFEDGHDVFFQSYLAIKKIIDIKGENVIQNILINSKSMNFYNAFEKVVGMNVDDFQKLLK